MKPDWGIFKQNEPIHLQNVKDEIKRKYRKKKLAKSQKNLI
jgi:hypothetical protein